MNLFGVFEKFDEPLVKEYEKEKIDEMSAKLSNGESRNSFNLIVPQRVTLNVNKIKLLLHLRVFVTLNVK